MGRTSRHTLSDPISEWNRRKLKGNNQAKKWYIDNPKQSKMIGLRNRAKKQGAIHLDDIYPDKVYERDQGICGICGKFVDLTEFTIDHKIPISRGGQHIWSNVQTAHNICNIRKGNK